MLCSLHDLLSEPRDPQNTSVPTASQLRGPGVQRGKRAAGLAVEGRQICR